MGGRIRRGLDLSGRQSRASGIPPAPLDFAAAHLPDEALGSVLAIEIGVSAGVAGFDAFLAVVVLILVAANDRRALGVEPAPGEFGLISTGLVVFFVHSIIQGHAEGYLLTMKISRGRAVLASLGQVFGDHPPSEL
jgi:hypothetical protein